MIRLMKINLLMKQSRLKHSFLLSFLSSSSSFCRYSPASASFFSSLSLTVLSDYFFLSVSYVYHQWGQCFIQFSILCLLFSSLLALYFIRVQRIICIIITFLLDLSSTSLFPNSPLSSHLFPFALGKSQTKYLNIIHPRIIIKRKKTNEDNSDPFWPTLRLQ